MVDFESRMQKLEIDLASLKEKMYFLLSVHEKLEVTLTKVGELMEQRRDNAKEDIKELYERIHECEKEVDEEIDSIRRDIKALEDSHQEKINKLEAWRWIIIGGSAVVFWIITKVASVLTKITF